LAGKRIYSYHEPHKPSQTENRESSHAETQRRWERRGRGDFRTMFSTNQRNTTAKDDGGGKMF